MSSFISGRMWGLVSGVCRSSIRKAGGNRCSTNPDTVALVCDGEIYNHKDLRSRFAAGHRFRSNSDCEIIPHLYEEMGMTHLSQLNGIFAFALLDQSSNKLYLCRDRLGVKPLFLLSGQGHSRLRLRGQGGACASRRSQKVRLGRGANVPKPDALPASGPSAHVVLRGHPLSAGRALSRYRLEHGRNSRADLLGSGAIGSCRRPAGDLDRQAYIRSYRDLLDDAVRLQLMADVPCGVFLSGGIDSARRRLFRVQA